MEQNELRNLLIKYSKEHSRLKKTEHGLQFAIQTIIIESISDLDPTISDFVRSMTIEEVDLFDMSLFVVTDFLKIHLNQKIESIALRGRIFDDQIVFRALNKDGSKLLKLTINVCNDIVTNIKIKVFEY